MRDKTLIALLMNWLTFYSIHRTWNVGNEFLYITAQIKCFGTC